MTCVTQDNFGLLQIGIYTFIVDQTDIEIEFPPSAEINVVDNNGILIQLPIIYRIIKFILLGGNDPNSTFPPMLTDEVINNISLFRQNQYNALLNNATPIYLHFDGFNATFNTGIITEITPTKGFKTKIGTNIVNVYDNLILKVNVMEQVWL